MRAAVLNTGSAGTHAALLQGIHAVSCQPYRLLHFGRPRRNRSSAPRRLLIMNRQTSGYLEYRQPLSLPDSPSHAIAEPQKKHKPRLELGEWRSGLASAPDARWRRKGRAIRLVLVNAKAEAAETARPASPRASFLLALDTERSPLEDSQR